MTISSFDKFKREIDSGYIKWGALHTPQFWEDNYKEFEYNNFEYIRNIVKIIQSDACGENDIEMKCVACFDLGEFARLYPGGAR